MLICWCADEEIGGKEGMKLFVESEEFRSLNSGFALDEGVMSFRYKLIAFFARKSSYCFSTS